MTALGKTYRRPARPAPPAPWKLVAVFPWGRRFVAKIVGCSVAMEAIDDDIEARTVSVVRSANLKYMGLEVVAEVLRVEQVLVGWLTGDGR